MTDWNVYARECPTRHVLGRAADTWTVLILGRLIERPMRFNALPRAIDGVSQKVLSQGLGWVGDADGTADGG